MNDHMRTHALIVQSDFEHLASAARGVVSAIARDGERLAIASEASKRYAQAQRVGSVARMLGRLVESHDPESVEWQKAIGHGSLDDVLQAVRVSLESVDPAKAVA